MANPVGINYRFIPDPPSRREAADPSFVTFKKEYYLFASKCGGYYHSPDLVHWTFVVAEEPLSKVIEEYAPAAWVLGDAIYYTGSADGRVYRTFDPKNGSSWTEFKWNFTPKRTDPMVFVDDDGKVYYYGGCSDKEPIYGCALNSTTLDQISAEVVLINENMSWFGWERMGEYNDNEKDHPWIEGSFMTRVGRKYYLQYANPGTSFKAYNDAIYESYAPLSNFTAARHNPFCYKPEGFIAGAGHGSTLVDNYGNLWHITTQAIAIRHNFERRLGLFPVFVDASETMYAYTGYGDWPYRIPDKKITGPDDLRTGWYLLSYKKPVVASSTYRDHVPVYAVDEDIRTWWSASSNHPGESFTINLTQSSTINAIQLNFADENSTRLGRSAGIYYQYIVNVSSDGANWTTIVDKSANTGDLPHDYIEFKQPVTAKYIRVVNVYTPSDMLFSLYGFRIFGKQLKRQPDAPKALIVRRDVDSRNVNLSWTPVQDAIGYNIRFGVSSNALYHNYIVYGQAVTSLQIRALRREARYWFSIDAFNEGGITRSAEVVESSGPFFSYNETTKTLTIWAGLVEPAHVSRWQSVAAHVLIGARTVLSNGTFGGFSKLVSVDALRSGITHVPSYCFENCKNLTKINLPPSVLSIGDGAFSSCTSLQNIELLSMTNLTTVGYAAFMFCKTLNALNLPSSIRSIGEAAFSHCSRLTVVYLEALPLLQAVPAQAFANCTSLTTITFPKALTGIGRYAFASCVALVNVVLRSTAVTEIGDSAFQSCTSLTAAALPLGLVTLGAAAFKGDAGLKVLEVGDRITNWGAGAFADCGGVTNLTFHGTHVGTLNCSVLNEVFGQNITITTDSKFSGDVCGHPVAKKEPKLNRMAITGIVSAAIVLCALIFVIITKCLSRDTMEEPLLQLRSEGPEYMP